MYLSTKLSWKYFYQTSFALIFVFATACKPSQITSSPEPSESPNVEDIIEIPQEKVSLDTLTPISLEEMKELELINYRGSRKRDFDIIHTDLDLSFDYKNQVVIGMAKLRIAPYFSPKQLLVLDAQDFEISKITFSRNENSNPIEYQYADEQIQILLPELLTRNDTFEIEIEYKAYPERNNSPGSEAITDTKGLYFIDPLDTIPSKPTMIWTQGETNHNSKWFPTIDSPNEKFTQLIKLTVADDLVTVGNGELIKQEELGNGLRKDYWEMKLPHSAYLTAFAIGNFDVIKANWEDVPLGYYVEKGFGKGAEKVFANTPEMIGFFSDLVGVRYPWPKYDQVVVRDFVSGAMENTTASIFMEELRMNEREAIDSEMDYIIAHELFHQWFGDYVTIESWSNLTLNEGFANYSEFLWNEYKYGADAAKLKLIAETENYFAEAETKESNLIRFQYKNAEDLFDSHSYSKGGAIIHMLREYLGKEVFYSALKQYLTTHAFGTVEVNDLRMAFESISGEDLNWFFNQWFLDKGHPDLIFEVDYSQPNNVGVTITQQQDLKSNPLYRLPIEVSWYVKGIRQSKTLTLEKVNQSFELHNGDAVDLVFIDEEKNILAKKSQVQSPVDMVKQFSLSKIGISRYEALDSLRAWGAVAELQTLMPNALTDEFWAIRESALSIIQGNPDWLKNSPSLEGKVYAMAETDIKNSVKAGAIDALSSLGSDKYVFAFKEMASDSSYLVSGSALMALVDLNEDIDLDYIDQFAEDNNFRTVIPLANYYLVSAVEGKGDWFFSKMDALSGEGKYYFLGYYGEYFSVFPDSGKEKATSYLLNIMKNDSADYMKIGAFQSLLSFAGDDRIMTKVADVMRAESNESMEAYYSNFVDGIVDEN